MGPSFSRARPASAPGLAILLFLAAAFAPAPGKPLEAAPAAGSTSGPTLALEDTLNPLVATLPEVYVHAPRVTLDEILRRVAEGEARRDSLMQDQSYRLLYQVVYWDVKRSGPARTRVKRDYAAQVYKKRPNLYREETLRSRGDADVEVSSGSSMDEDLVSFAFEPHQRARFLFHILDRRFTGGHVIYVVSFEPRSRVDLLPEGRVWIDTNEFVIAREEFWYRDRSPAPLFIKSIDSCILERERVDGRWWVLTRLLARVRTTSALRLLGKVARDDVPRTIDVVLRRTHWRVNSGLADSFFADGSR